VFAVVLFVLAVTTAGAALAHDPYRLDPARDRGQLLQQDGAESIVG